MITGVNEHFLNKNLYDVVGCEGSTFTGKVSSTARHALMMNLHFTIISSNPL